MAGREITLPVGATAEPDTCGSCKFFDRMGADFGPAYAMDGRCRFILPPTLIAGFALKPYADGDENRDRMKDISRCDLQRPDGKIYIVQRRVPPERAG